MMQTIRNECRDDLQYRLFIESVTDYAIYTLDPDGFVTNWNAGAERIKGYTATAIIGRNFACFYSGEDQAAGVPSANLAVAKSLGRFEDEGWRYRQDGSRFWASVVIEAIFATSKLVGFAKITRDKTIERRHSIALQAMSNNLRLILSVLPYGACLLDDQLRIVLFNPAFTDLFRVSRSPVAVGTPIIELLRRQGRAQKASLAEFVLMLQQRDRWTEGCEIEVENRSVLVVLRSTADGGVVATFQESERSSGALAADPINEIDHLTALHKRSALIKHLDEVLTKKLPSFICTMLAIDLDDFKTINELLGHDVGDAALRETARRITETVQPDGLVFRSGGDKFAVVVSGLDDISSAKKLGENIRARLARPFETLGEKFDLSISVGIASALSSEATTDELIVNTHMALQRAKQSGGNRCCLYDADISLSASKRRAMEGQLRRALKAGEFELYYQPIVDATNLEIKGFESLIRWVQTDGSQIPPSEFVPLAEELGLMNEIGSWVMRSACNEAAKWPSHLTVAINVSSTQLSEIGFVDSVASILHKSQLRPRQLELEITETAMIKDPTAALNNLTALRDLGVFIAIDDFGTGYSSLGTLQTLPFSRIKIDRQFIQNIPADGSSMAIVKAVMQMSQELGLAVTAEGVETEMQRQALIEHGCQDLQGYLVSKPVSRAEMIRLIDRSMMANRE